MKKVIYIIMCALMLTACETELEYNGPGSDPILYIVAELSDSAGAVNDILVGHTNFFVNGIDSSRLEDAVIEIAREDGDFVETGYDYVTPDDLRPGEKLRLRVTQKDFGVANAEAVCPPNIDVEVLSFKVVESLTSGRSFDVRLRFSCDGLEVADDFYWRMSVYGYYSEAYQGDTTSAYMSMMDWSSTDPVLMDENIDEDINILNLLFGYPNAGNYMPIKFEGSEQEANVRIETYDGVYYYDAALMPEGDEYKYPEFFLDTLVFVVDVISDDMAKYVKAKHDCMDGMYNPFKEASLMYTNMDNGMGIFTIKSKREKYIKVDR